MLPRSRLLSIALVGLGAIVLSVGLVLPIWFPASDALPRSISGWTVRVTDPQARVGQEVVPVTQQLHVDLQPSGADDVLVRVGRTVMRDTPGVPDGERLVDAQVVSYRMDRASGEALGSATWSTVLATPPRQEGMGGVWLKFPADTHAQEYGVFDEVTRKAVLAKPVGEDTLDGRTVLRFQQTVPDTIIVEPESDEPTSGLGPRPEVALNAAGDPAAEADAQGLPVEHYQAQREIFVEPATGIIINEKVRSHRWMEFPDGSKQTVLAFQGEFPESTREEMWQLVEMFPNIHARALVATVLQWLGGLLLVVGAVTVFVGVRRPRAVRP
ncbi:DUF3068 domain-containing protein [Corynebacterium sp. 13CS0277]|uniref:DUF3068 domain-containing protein n=1 Tax=Corynebacterium sp. 13CS0277 TaxID=2071994 RepID=UPI000D037BD1|nr:DUF3068 domain-containing protein [Corynebacterium sp. 13CS0277]